MPALDHGGELAYDRDGAELVLAALAREPDVTFAAGDDPWPTHRRLVGERAEHEAVLARCPVDRSRHRQGLVNALHRQKYRLAEAENEPEAAREALRALRPLRRVRSSGRAAHAGAEDRLADVRKMLTRRRGELAEADERLAALAAHQADRESFLAREGWRSDRIYAIDDELAQHWAPIVLAAVRADDPLAFGIGRLRAARTTYGADLGRILRSPPPDRTEAVERARREAVSASAGVAKARAELVEATAVADQARQRYWGRRDRSAVERAEGRVGHAEQGLSGAVERERSARRRLKTETEAQRARERALRDNRGAMTELECAVVDIDGALEHTRPGRVLDMLHAEQPPAYLTDVLGAAPATVAGRQAWCGLAWEIESYRDAHPAAADHGLDRGVQAALGQCPEWYTETLAWPSSPAESPAAPTSSSARLRTTRRRISETTIVGRTDSTGPGGPRSQPGAHHRDAWARDRFLIVRSHAGTAAGCYSSRPDRPWVIPLLLRDQRAGGIRHVVSLAGRSPLFHSRIDDLPPLRAYARRKQAN